MVSIILCPMVQIVEGGDLGVVYGNPVGFVQGDAQAIGTVYRNFLYVEGDILRMIDENVVRFLDSDVIGIFDENIV